ncbi:MAG: stage II sporulation protein P [Clostridia bacterium]|nr:stage II sporulation protein P [Clostridia bacterium]
MKLFSALFDGLCVFVVFGIVLLLYTKYDKIISLENNQVAIQDISKEELKVDNTKLVDNNTTFISDSGIEYYNEASVSTDIPVFTGLVSSSSSGPQILIYHTHTSETYFNDQGSVVDVGNLLADLLRAKGYNVIHDTTINDADYNNSYETVYVNVEKILKANPTIQCIIDVHRDSATKDMVVKDQGIEYAKLMLVVGTNVRLSNSIWENNLSFAKAIHLNCLERVDEIIKPIYLSKNRYNQHLCQNSVIVEVGGLENTIFEALNATYILAEAIDSSLQGK